MSELIRDDELERECCDEECPSDDIWIRNGRGKMLRLEVEDDATDDTAQ